MNHIGQNIRRLREFRGLKQDVLALELGISQQSVSKLEQSESVTEETLIKIAGALPVSVNAILQFSEKTFLEYCHHSTDTPKEISPPEPSTNALHKVFELYERLLQAEREKLEYMERLLGK